MNMHMAQSLAHMSTWIDVNSIVLFLLDSQISDLQRAQIHHFIALSELILEQMGQFFTVNSDVRLQLSYLFS